MKSYAELARIAKQINSTINDPEYLTAFLAKKASDLVSEYPGDSTAKNMAVVLESLSNKNTLISRGQLSNLYNKFYTNNNKFALAFSSELGIKTEEDRQKEASDKRNAEDAMRKSASASIDQYKPNEMLAAAMESVLSGRRTVPQFTDTQKKNALASIQEKLSILLPSVKFSLAADAGNQKIIVVRACASTANGQGTVFLPVEVLQNNECLPLDFFVGNDGVKDVTANHLVESLKDSIGKSLRYDGKIVLAGIMSKFEKRANLNTVDLAFIKENFIQNNPVYASTDAFISQPPVEQVKRASLEHHFVKEENEFTSKMMTKSAQAELKFGKDMILEAKKVAYNQLRKLGQTASSINVIGYDDSGINLSLSLAGKSVIETYVKLAESKNLCEAVADESFAKGFLNLIKYLIADNNGDDEGGYNPSKANVLSTFPKIDINFHIIIDSGDVRAEITEDNGQDIGNARNKIYDAVVSACKELIYTSKVNGNDCDFIFNISNDKLSKIASGKSKTIKLAQPQVSNEFIHQGTKYPMESNSFRNIYNKEMSSYEKALHSPLLRTNANDIILEIIRCGKAGNHELAEQGLAVIKEKYADKYAMAIKSYQDSLLPQEVVASCNKQIQLKTSSHPLCGHTMLPLKDTYIDKDGHCRPNYRRNQ
jgi:hypothetical protein